jgi:methyl-accepting chemotaxis protein
VATEELVEKYYGVVERHLRDVGLWEETVRRFPPGSIRAAVKRILERMAEHGYDPEMLDWGALFELLKDHPTVEAFIRYLERERYIPPSVREEEARTAEELEREVTDLLRKAKEVDPRILERLLPRIHALLGREAEIDRLRREVSELRARASRSREEAERYGRKVEELRRELERLRSENEALRRELERLKAARPAPPPPPPPPPLPAPPAPPPKPPKIPAEIERWFTDIGRMVDEAKARVRKLYEELGPLNEEIRRLGVIEIPDLITRYHRKEIRPEEFIEKGEALLKAANEALRKAKEYEDKHLDDILAHRSAVKKIREELEALKDRLLKLNLWYETIRERYDALKEDLGYLEFVRVTPFTDILERRKAELEYRLTETRRELARAPPPAPRPEVEELKKRVAELREWIKRVGARKEELAKVGEELERRYNELASEASEALRSRDAEKAKRLLDELRALQKEIKEKEWDYENRIHNIADEVARAIKELRSLEARAKELGIDLKEVGLEGARKELEAVSARGLANLRQIRMLIEFQHVPDLERLLKEIPPKPRPEDVERLRRRVEALRPDVEEAKRLVSWLRDVAEPLQKRYQGLVSELTREPEVRDAERGEALAKELEEFLKTVKGVLRDFEATRDEASRKVAALRRAVSELASEARRLGAEPREVGLDGLAGEVEGVADALAKLPNPRMMVITAEDVLLPSLRRAIERLKAARPAPKLPGPPPPTPLEEVAKRPPPPKPKVLPPIPETCPIDGTPLERLSKVPLPGLGGVIEFVDVPPTIAVYRCQGGHFFEVEPSGRLVERRPEHLVRDILRELARTAKAVARVGVPAFPEFALPIFRPRDVVYADFRTWLFKFKGITPDQFVRMPDVERRRLIDEWLAYKGMRRPSA